MYPYNRRPYIIKEPEKKLDKNIPESTDNTEVNASKSSDLENIKLLLENVKDIKDSLKKLEESMADIASRLTNLEARFEMDSKYINTQIQFDTADTNNQIRSQKNDSYELSTSYQPEENNDTPIMPGAGFSCITKDYLRNLTKNRQNKI